MIQLLFNAMAGYSTSQLVANVSLHLLTSVYVILNQWVWFFETHVPGFTLTMEIKLTLIKFIDIPLKAALWAGVEHAWGNPIGFQVQRLNLSAITAGLKEIPSAINFSIYNSQLMRAIIWNLFKSFAVSRVRTCAGKPHWISSPTP